jgi:hypothetical protein
LPILSKGNIGAEIGFRRDDDRALPVYEREFVGRVTRARAEDLAHLFGVEHIAL